MQGTVAQIIALTTYGNAFVFGAPAFDVSGFYPANSTFLFCEYVRFVYLRQKGDAWEEVAYADDPPAWFARLKKDGVNAIRMIYGSTGGQKLDDKQIADRMLAGFVGGGGRWLIETITTNGSDFWEARWEVGDQNRADNKIWRVTYRRIASNRPTLERQAIDMHELKTRLADNLAAIGNFARMRKLDGFAKAFDAGLARLNAQDPYKSVYRADLAPDRALPLAAAQLLGAAQAAWVFGGMGSWNDLWIEKDDQSLYEQLSEDLYQLLNAAIVTAANTSTPPIPANRPRP
jgi:hypothetical protein